MSDIGAITNSDSPAGPAGFEAALERLESKSARIGVVGLGYVGLPLCLAFAEAGCQVIGFDIDPKKPEHINAGKTYLNNIDGTRIKAAVANGTFSATTDFNRFGEVEAILICVPTPLTHHLEPDLSFVEGTVHAIAERLRPGQLVVLESTTYPGTTSEVVRPILESTGLVVGTDFWLGFSPEREDPGNVNFSTTTIPKVVGADDGQSRRLVAALYRSFAHEIVEVSTSSTAEAVKLTENIFRAVNIALANELKLVYGAMGIDVWEVVDAAKTKPFGYMPFYPGPGLGGHCIPIDPFYLTWKAREYNVATRFIELAGQINSRMPEHVVSELARAHDNRTGRGLNGACILVLGLAYKKNVDDTRESPALRLMDLLRERGAKVDYYDPHVPVIPNTREHPQLAGQRSVPWNLEDFAGYDVTLIASDHDAVDYKGLARAARLVVDTRNACARAGADLANVVAA